MTTPPTADDNPALAGVVLDMKLLAEMDDVALFASLRQLTVAYTEWIAINRARTDAKADGLDEFDATARQALDDCAEAQQRIDAGIALLETDAAALRSFRFANRAMWQQRIHALFAGSRPHYLIDTINELPEVIADINRRLAKGEMPQTS